jgi:DNA-binding response OmpR family regulator
LNILVVEDDFHLSSLYAELLDTDYIAGDVSEALKILDTMIPDAVVLDINLVRDFDGIALLNWIRSQQKYDRMSVIMVTAYSLPIDLQGADLVLQKPLNILDLPKLIEEAVRDRLKMVCAG